MKIRLLVSVLGGIFVLGSAYARTWTDVTGRKINAEFLEVLGDKVKIKMDDSGKEFEVLLSKLSSEDQNWIKEQLASKEAVKETPKKSKRTFRRRSRFDVATDAEKPANWDAKWPEVAKVETDIAINILEENVEEDRFVYTSPHYKFICDVPLSKTVVSRFALLFETTHEYCRLLPINLQRPKRDDNEVLYEILLFETKQNYIQNGGPPRSAGIFSPGTNQIKVPLTSLGVKKVGSSYMIDHKLGNGTLSHEITHQLTDSPYFKHGAGGWFSEGLAEYISNTKYRSGRYSIKNNMRNIRESVTEYDPKAQDGRRLGTDLTAPDLKEFMLQPYSNFTGNNPNFNYGFSCLLVYYFFHFEDEGSRKNIVAFLKALREGKAGKDAVDTLLAGRTVSELEESISKEWKKRGISINFR